MKKKIVFLAMAMSLFFFVSCGGGEDGDDKIVIGGSLTIAVDADTPKENIVVAGTSDVDISKFRFSAVDEAFVVTKLSINNRQSGVDDADLGENDNNVASVLISYTNSNGETESKTGYLTEGIAKFSGLDMFIEKDEDAVLTVKATLNTISQGATSGEVVALNLAFNNFEAIAQTSGEIYKASDLDFGQIACTDTTLAFATGTQPVTLGTSATLTTPDLNVSLPIGTIIKLGEDTVEKATNDILLILTTKYTDGDLTINGLVADNGDGDADSANVWYALPGEGYLVSTNFMHIYESKPTVLLASSSPSGHRTVSASDEAFMFTVVADAKEKVAVRAGADLTSTATAGVGAVFTPVADTDAGDQLDGSSVLCATVGYSEGDTFAFSTTSDDLSAYARVNFWFKITTVGGVAPKWTDLAIGSAAYANAVDQRTILSQSACGADTATIVSNQWYNCDMEMPTGTAVGDDTLHFEFITGLLIDTIHIDRMIVYNEKIVVKVASDRDIDTYANNTGAPVVAYLKESGSTIATGYIVSDTNGATTTDSALVAFIPIEADGDIEVAKGTSTTFTLQLDTSALLNENPGVDDPVTFWIDLGTATGGTVTPGGFWWYDTNTTVRWCGQVANTTLNGNTLWY